MVINGINRVRGFELVKDAPADTVLPSRKTKCSAGYDFYAPYDILIYPLQTTHLIPLNVKAYMQDNEVLELYIRSSLAVKQQIKLINAVGIIDADYYSNPDNDGNIGIMLENASASPVVIKKGERICQGIFKQYLVADNDDVSAERTGGYGSTGL